MPFFQTAPYGGGAPYYGGQQGPPAAAGTSYPGYPANYQAYGGQAGAES